MLSDILQAVSETVGIQSTDDVKRGQLLRMINRAARELYDSADLPNSITDNTFAFDDVNLRQISLPWRVAEVRAARYAEFGSKISIESLQPRYHAQPWKDPLLMWRIVGQSPLERSLAQATQLRFTLAGTVETTPVQITVVGQTTTATRAIETVTINAGETFVTTSNQWTQDNPQGIESIQKSRITDSDIIVQSTGDDVRVATIYNRALIADNLIIRITEDDIEMTIDQGVQILYKKRLVPLWYNQDTFINDRYEDALVWKVQEHWNAKKEGGETQAILASQKCDQLMTRLTQNAESRSEKSVGHAPLPYDQAAINYAKC